MFKTLKLLVAGTVMAAVTGVAIAQDDKAKAKAIDARKGLMQVIAFQMGQLGGMAKGKAPYDAAKASMAAANLNLAAQINAGPMWIKGTDNVAMAGKTRAKPDIWEEGSDVGQKNKDFMMAAAKLAEEAGKGQEALAAAFGPVGKSCGGCHKPFRGPKN